MPHEESVTGLAQADLKRLTVKLPPGIAISLSAANGLEACTPSEIGLHDENPPACPESSMLGEAEVVTPLLEVPLKGRVYLAQQETFGGSLIGLYLVAGEGSGVLVKLAGTAALDPNTGQVTLTFDGVPQLPIDEIKLSLPDGPRAALATPSACGTYTTNSQLTPWSEGAPAEESSDFTIDSNCGQSFSPSFTAGTTNPQAGAFSQFSVTFSRRDGEQRLGSVRVVGPPGLLATLAGVARCPEPQASTGECGAASEIGEASVAAGPGIDPFWITGARIYLTGSTSRQGPNQSGAPFGLSIVSTRDRGTVSPRHGGRARARRSEPLHRAADDRERSAAGDGERRAAGHPHGEHDDRAGGVHVQPDRLQPAVDRRDALLHQRH